MLNHVNRTAFSRIKPEGAAFGVFLVKGYGEVEFKRKRMDAME
jgi:hypothetical protein